jgi:hypothetical protein
MWDLIWTVVSAITCEIALKFGAEVGEQRLIALARWIVSAQVRTLPTSQRMNMAESILADFEARPTTVEKLKFAIQMVSAQMKLVVIHSMKEGLRETVRDIRLAFFAPYPPPFGNILLLPICKVMRRHTWKHHCNPALHYCRICGTQAPRWMGVHNGHGGYHCDLNVNPNFTAS